MPDDVVIPWGFGCVPAVAMGVGTVFGSQRMTTTVGASPSSLPATLFDVHYLRCHGPVGLTAAMACTRMITAVGARNKQAAVWCFLLLRGSENCCPGVPLLQVPLAFVFSGVRLMHFSPARAFAVLTAACLTRITADAIEVSLSHTYVQASDPSAAWITNSNCTDTALLQICGRGCN